MRKLRKVMALLMTLAMVMGLSLTAFAAPATVADITSNVTIEGLSADVDTTVKMYRFATLQHDAETNEYSWAIADWADEYVVLNEDGTAYEIASENEADLKNAAQSQTNADYQAEGIKGTSHTFTGVQIGGYVIIPADSN